MSVNWSIFETSSQIQHQIWVGTGGAMLVLLQSILSGQRRVWWRLLLSCTIGGAASALAGHVFEGSSWVYVWCGVAAIMAENVIFGLVNASEEFKNNPINVFAQLWRVIMPSFGRGIDKPAEDLIPGVHSGGDGDHDHGRGRHDH